MSEWISVKDQPIPKHHVLATDGETVGVITYLPLDWEDDGLVFINDEGWFKPVAWMPLPEPPKEPINPPTGNI